jgi:chromosome segregation protein
MYFKSIEMRGFKSFVDETKIIFEQGATVIVGPNGCGKSNIADGIRWVLGEQSAKIMRGMKMEDFIFNGSATRKPTGFAEVTITVSNVKGSITSQAFADYDEIAVTRKLYRTGESEYYINKIPCRLKDIVDIFLDTGISTRSFSIIEQGQVTKFINSKPEERRFIIEEAAGVMKYKYRRNAALNKMEASQQNLLRIQDILGELERQRNSLHRQAKKAERYKEFRSEIKSCALIHSAGEYQALSEEMERTSAILTIEKQREASLMAETDTRRNEAEVLSAQVVAEERGLSTLREERQGLVSSIERNDLHRETLAKQIEDLAQTRQRALHDKEGLEKETAFIEGEITRRQEDIAAISGEMNGLQSAYDNARGEAMKTRALLGDKQTALTDGTRKAMKIVEEISSRQNRLSSLKARLEMTASRVEALLTQEQEVRNSIAEAQGRLTGINERIVSLSRAIENGKTSHADVVRRLREAEADFARVDAELRTAENEITRLGSRLESLMELDKNLEGYGEGVRGLMKKKNAGDSALSGVKGLLADSVRVTPEMETALGAILSDKLEAVIVESARDAVSAVSLLRGENLGRASFMVSGTAKRNTPPRPQTNHPDFAGYASDLIQLDDKVPASASAMLENVVLARSLEGALAIWGENPGACSVVTLDGDVVDMDGVITGGVKLKSSGAGIVARKRAIEELRSAVSDLQAKKAFIVENKAVSAEAVVSLKAEVAKSETESRRLEMESRELSNEARREDGELKRFASQLASNIKEKEGALAEAGRLADEERRLLEEAQTFTSAREDVENANAILQTEVESLRAGLDEITQALSREEVKLAEARARLENLKTDEKRLSASITDIKGRIARLAESASSFETRTGEAETSIQALVQQNIELIRKKDGLSEQVTQASNDVNEKISRRDELEKAARESSRALEEVRAANSIASLKASELSMRLDNVAEKADAEFNIPLDDLKNADITSANMEETQKRLAYLRGELGRIGDVNMSSVEEYEEVNTRYEFMKTQSADLVTSIATLRKTIESINATTADLFDDTFKIVARNFEEIFKRLFGGGRAEMKLVQEEGQAEPGLEILVQPPGKKVQNLNLLSSGEKAMTAIAVLFAVFRAKPSPFCLLDEVDAPLDEANIFRFRDMLEEMKDKTQFIIITHNQKTMGFADRMYGITQEEEGVSKVLSVNLVNRHAETPEKEEEEALTAA